MSAAELDRIEARRVELGVNIDALERLAGIARGHYRRLVAGGTQPQASTLAALKLALQRYRLRQAGDEGTEAHLTIAYRFALALAAEAIGCDPAEAQTVDPSARATKSPRWSRSVEARRIAVYLLNCGVGIKQAHLARAVGVTKQAVNSMVRDIEDRRDDDAFDALMNKLTDAVLGDW